MRLTSLDKVLWPDAGLTKGDLLGYYEAAAGRLLPHLERRPLTLKRHHAGVDADGFFQKDAPASAPVERFVTRTQEDGHEVAYPVVGSVEDLRWCAQQNAVELHPWFARIDRPERPDVCAFDLDPASPEQPVAWVARAVRDVLGELGLDVRVKTSGKRGLHLYVPVERRYEFSELRGFALGVSRACADRHPEELTVEMRKADRDGRLLLDWSRPGRAQTSAAPYSPRATPQATVSTPLDWDELTDDLEPGRFTVTTVLDRDDPWAEPAQPQRIERALAALRASGYDCADRSPRARTTT